jgi:hypothetical protein
MQPQSGQMQHWQGGAQRLNTGRPATIVCRTCPCNS